MYTLVTTFFLLNLFFPTAFSEAAATEAAAQPASSGKIDPRIVATSDQYLKTVLAGDPAAVSAMYLEDGVLMPSERPMLRGRVAIEQYYREWFKAKITTFTFSHLESPVIGDTAYDVGTYKLTMSPAPGVTITDCGKYNVILKRSEQDWKVAYVIFNSDAPHNAPPSQARAN
jgi:ketosteroid isomerase-like protein